MVFPVEIKDDIVIIHAKNVQVDQKNIVETLTMFIDDPSAYCNKNLLIIDPGSEYNPTNAELQQFSNLIKSLLNNIFSRIALVAPREFHFGLGRMAEVFSESKKGKFRAFKDESEAQAWLCE